MTEAGESEWSKLASKHADKVDCDIAYFKEQSAKCSRWHRGLSVMALILAASTAIFISLATALKGTWTGDFLQYASIVLAGMISLVEGLARFFAFDRRWASNYLAIWALRRARWDYKMNRIGLAGEQWQEAFKAYVNRYFDIINKENAEFFSLVQPVGIGAKKDPSPSE